MSVPAKRRSRSKGKRGRSHQALAKKNLVKCDKCGKKIMPHRVCPFCGNYQGKEIVKPMVKKKKNN
ncbi:50S ribosomal protein L32 [Candidatus Falkowbacteria bacterium]|nr:50S ribosomal protein L32 [Candidatus Falkowbacteria bacterium]